MNSLTNLNDIHYKKAHNLSPSGIIIFNKTDDIIYANKKTLQLLKYSNREISSIKINDILTSKIKNNKTSIVTDKEGNVNSIIITTNKLLEKKSGLSIIYFNKISDYAKLNQHKAYVKEKKELLINIDKVKSEFDSLINQCLIKSNQISNIAHDLKAPLGVVSTSLSLIEEYAKRGDIKELNKHIVRIKYNLNNVNSVIINLLNDDEKYQTSTTEKVNIKLFINQIVGDHKILLKKGQIINYNHFGKHTIQINKFNLSRIISNLISNSSKFSKENKPIKLNSILLPDKFIITIIDQGIGIPINEQHKIFQKNFRCANSIKIAGNGLGLNTIKSIIEELSGTISVKSIQNKGTTVRIDIPQ